MNNIEKINYINKNLSNKEWRNGCRFYYRSDKYKHQKIILACSPSGMSSSAYIEDGKIKMPTIGTSDINPGKFIYLNGSVCRERDMKLQQKELLKDIYTIGQNVYFGNILKFIQENYKGQELQMITTHLIDSFGNKIDLPIERQEEKTLNYVIDVLKTINN